MAKGLLDPEGKVQLKWYSAQNKMTTSYTFPHKKVKFQSRQPSRKECPGVVTHEVTPLTRDVLHQDRSLVSFTRESKTPWASAAWLVASTWGCPWDKSTQAPAGQELSATVSPGLMCHEWDATQGGCPFMVTKTVTEPNLGLLACHTARQIYWHWVVLKESTLFYCRAQASSCSEGSNSLMAFFRDGFLKATFAVRVAGCMTSDWLVVR